MALTHENKRPQTNRLYAGFCSRLTAAASRHSYPSTPTARRAATVPSVRRTTGIGHAQASKRLPNNLRLRRSPNRSPSRSTSPCIRQLPPTKTDILASRNRTWGQDFAWPHTVGSGYRGAAPGPAPTGSECDLHEEGKPVPIRAPERQGACGHKTDTDVNTWARNRICGQRPEWERSVKGTGRERAPSHRSQGAGPGTEKGPL